MRGPKRPLRASLCTWPPLRSAFWACLLLLCFYLYHRAFLAATALAPSASLYAPGSRARLGGGLPAQRLQPAAAPLHHARPGRQVLALYHPHLGETAGSDFAALRSSGSGASGPWGYPVLHPFEGYYSTANYQTRQRQGRLALAYGLDGFVYVHHWAGGAPARAAGLEAMLVDSEPNLPFALAWENSASGGGAGAEAEWRAHFEWLLPFFRHANYLTRGEDGGAARPLLFLARCVGLEAMLLAWRGWAAEAGLGGLYIVQLNGREWAPGVLSVAAGVDGAAELQPALAHTEGGSTENAPSLANLQRRKPADYGATPSAYFRGVHAGYSDWPRVAAAGGGPAADAGAGAATVLVYHPTNLRAALRAQLALTPPGSFVLLNAWNDWGAGCAIEPSVEFGYAWLEAVQGAVAGGGAGGSSGGGVAAAAVVTGDYLPRLAPAGVVAAASASGAAPPPPQSQQQRVCILVRTYVNHDDASEALFNLGRMLRTLVALEHAAWEAHVVDTGERVFANLRAIVAGVGDARISVLDTPPHLRQAYSGRTSSYDLTDYALAQACTAPASPLQPAAWFVVTNGDNFYAPDAFNYLPSAADMVLMNFYSRYSLANAVTFTGAGMEGCCSRLAHYRCTPASPEVAFVDVGAMVVRVESWRGAALSFAQFHGACGAASCHDGALAQHVLGALHWRLAYHPVGACAMHHNPNPVSCALVGGLYLDDPDWARARCLEPADWGELPLGKGDVDWEKFVAGEGCVCKEG
jgi:hypothetical protein